MKHTIATIALLSLSSALATQASAQAIKPGLWEIKSSLGKGYGKSIAAIAANNKKMMADMPAEARKEMEAIDAQTDDEVRYTDDHVITKSCLTKAQVSRIDETWIPKGKCKEQRSPIVGGVMKVSFSCTDPQSTGGGTLRFQGDTGFEMQMASTTTFQGQRHTVHATAAGKWLGADCGKIEPDTGED